MSFKQPKACIYVFQDGDSMLALLGDDLGKLRLSSFLSTSDAILSLHEEPTSCWRL
jgi:hypothetical protein